ncbi:hypothetical protein KIPB_006875, partial [Kipferlia bialata]
ADIAAGSVTCSQCQAVGTDMWLCLQCCKTYCGDSLGGHSRGHLHRTQHNVYINTCSGVGWCFLCNRAIMPVELKKEVPRLHHLMAALLTSPSTSSGHMTKRVFTGFGTVGLENMGNTCYLSAALQALCHIPSFSKYFLALYPYIMHTPMDPMLRRNSDPEATMRSLMLSHFAQLCTSMQVTYTTVCPKDVLRPFQVLTQLPSFEQQDSAEFMRLFFSNIHRALSPTGFAAAVPSPRLISKQGVPYQVLEGHDRGAFEPFGSLEEDHWQSIVSRSFKGSLRSHIKCLECGYESVSDASFRDIMLTLGKGEWVRQQFALPADQRSPRFKRLLASIQSDLALVNGLTGSRRHSINLCLASLVREETFTDDNRYNCPKCEAKTHSQRHSAFYTLPEVLVLQVKRFSYSLFGRKISDRVSFPLTGLDLAPFLDEILNVMPTPDTITFSLEGETEDGWDYVRVYKATCTGGGSIVSGTTTQVGQSHTGTFDIDTTVSMYGTYNCLLVTFTTDGSFSNFDGFEFEWYTDDNAPADVEFGLGVLLIGCAIGLGIIILCICLCKMCCCAKPKPRGTTQVKTSVRVTTTRRQAQPVPQGMPQHGGLVNPVTAGAYVNQTSATVGGQAQPAGVYNAYPPAPMAPVNQGPIA